MDSGHSESEFYYPDEVEKFSDEENIGSQQKENEQKAQFTMASVQKYILTQCPENAFCFVGWLCLFVILIVYQPHQITMSTALSF